MAVTGDSITAVVSLGTVIVLGESPCPQGPIYKSLSLFLDHKVFENFQGFRILQTICYSVTATVHEDTVKNVLLTDVRYYLLIYMYVSK